MTDSVRTGPLDAALAKLCHLGEAIAMVLVALVTLLVVAQVVAREIFVVGLAWADEASRWAGLGVIFLVVPLIALHGGHVRVDMFINLLPEGARRVVQGLNEWLGVLFCAPVPGRRLVLPAARRALHAAGDGTVEPLVLHAGRGGHGAAVPGDAAPCAGRPVRPAAADRQRRERWGKRDMMSLSLVVLFLLFVVMGLPIAMAMGLAAGAVVWFFDMPLAVLAQRTINSLDSTPLLAVPMFIFAAAIFNNTGITTQLFDFMPHADRPHPRRPRPRHRGHAPGVLGRVGRGAGRHRRARQHPDPT